MSKLIYTYDKCYEIAKQCSCASEMRHLNGSAYNAARHNKWLKDYDWFIRKQHTPYTYDEVYEIAKLYNCSSDFQKGNGSAYGKARSNGWIKDYTWFETKRIAHNKKWFYDNTLEEAQKYATRTEFARKVHGAYKAAVANKWIDEFFPK